MRIAIVGAGIAGITTAHELAVDGHQVTVLEQQESVAAGASFAHSGLIAPALLEPVARADQKRALLRRSPATADALDTPRDWSGASRRWRRQWQSACAHGSDQARLSLIELGRWSLRLQKALTSTLHLDHERSDGVLVVARDSASLDQRMARLEVVQASGQRVTRLDAEGCRQVEPGLNPDTQLAGGIRIEDGGVGNCREFVHQLRLVDEARHGVKYHFGVSVCHLRRKGDVLQLRLSQRQNNDDESAPARQKAFLPTRPMELPSQLEFDAVVLATGPNAQQLLREAGAYVPLMPVWGRTATFRLRDDWAQLPLRSAVVDAETGMRLTRMGQRLRVGGGHVLGALPQGDAEQLYLPLYQALDRWLPLAARRGDVQLWQGARPTLPDGLPLIGPAPLEGVWLQLGHADHGWTLACGAARLLADQIAGRGSEIDAAPFNSLSSRGWS